MRSCGFPILVKFVMLMCTSLMLWCPSHSIRVINEPRDLANLFIPNSEEAENHNLPAVIDANVESILATSERLSLQFNSSAYLLHQANPLGQDVVAGLAVYQNYLKGFKRLIGSLRLTARYTGHIILGVHPLLTEEELVYLKFMNVTLYSIEKVPCTYDDTGVTVTQQTKLLVKQKKAKNSVRNTCARGLESLSLEWGRFEMARSWIAACSKAGTCSGWALIIDTRDVYFQSNPFAYLDKSAYIQQKADIVLIEEIAPYSSPDKNPIRSFVAGNPRNEAHTVGCYGRQSYNVYSDRPVLCSGTILGSIGSGGINRFLRVLVHEFMSNNVHMNIRCHSPHTTDQWIMNWLYYHGRFGSRTMTIPWGTGPVLTVGKACMTADRKTGATDLLHRDAEGCIRNNHELQVIAPVVHQFDRCGNTLMNYFRTQPWFTLSTKEQLFFHSN